MLNERTLPPGIHYRAHFRHLRHYFFSTDKTLSIHSICNSLTSKMTTHFRYMHRQTNWSEVSYDIIAHQYALCGLEASWSFITAILYEAIWGRWMKLFLHIIPLQLLCWVLYGHLPTKTYTLYQQVLTSRRFHSQLVLHGQCSIARLENVGRDHHY